MILKKRLFLLVVCLALGCSACAEVRESSPSDEVKAFFVAANEANFLAAGCLSPQQADLSAYNSYMGVKYPPTTSVEVLSGPPSRPYQPFARLQVAAPAYVPIPSSTIAKLLAKARDIGGDAVILCQRTPGQVARVDAVVIKYRVETDAPGK